MNGKKNNAYEAFLAASPDNELVAMVAHGLFKRQEKSFLESSCRPGGKAPSAGQLNSFFTFEMTEVKKASYIAQAEQYLTEAIAKAAATAVQAEVDQAIKDVEDELIGDMRDHIQDWSVAQAKIAASLGTCEASISRLSGFWRGVFMNGISGVITGILGMVLTGLVVAAYLYKDLIVSDANGIHIAIPKPAGGASR